jgi:hypothetical protein
MNKENRKKRAILKELIRQNSPEKTSLTTIIEHSETKYLNKDDQKERSMERDNP